MVDRISAAENLTIELQPDRWRLIANGGMEENVVVEASPGSPLRYIAGFGRTRRLPENGALSVEHIQRVVLGWSQQDEAWHLGFVLNSELAQARGSRWCELAHWPDPDTDVYDELALRAGKSLAQAVERPFYLVPPQIAPAPLVPAEPLPEPPFQFEQWTFERAAGDNFQFVRARSSALTAVRRILWYALWVIVYIILVVRTLTAGIAPAKPEWLPYLGIAAALLLVVLILRNLYKLLTEPNRIVIDGSKRAVRAFIGTRERWRLFAGNQIESVYVSHVAYRRSDGNSRAKSVFYGEINLYLRNGKFRRIMDMERLKTIRSRQDEPERVDDVITPLTLNQVETPMQAAGLYIAQALGVPCLEDQRSH
jgi:hypothetical protein